MSTKDITDAQIKLHRLDKRIAKLVQEREELVREMAYAKGWRPCDDCFDGYCSMNCSSAPISMQVLA